MSGFSTDWLGLREPADVAARSQSLTRFVSDAMSRHGRVSCLDLGSGTGSNVRYLASRLAVAQRWCLVDDDPRLLADARARLTVAVDTTVADLGQLDASMFETVDFVTASALLDLVSGHWLGELVTHCAKARATVLFALNYDGRIACTPSDEDDEFVRDLVNRHQRTDKGFGAALGPDAGARAEDLLRRAGYTVRRASSDWVLDGLSAGLQQQLIAGWASAASEMTPIDGRRIDGWRQRRLTHVSSSQSVIVVGHLDIAGVPGV